MTKEQLEQLIDLRKEIKELESKLEDLSQRKIERTTDKVKASYKNFPYIQGSARITGFDTQAYEKNEQAIDKYIKLLTSRKRKAEKLELEITEYINTVEDSRIRRMLQYRYIEGYTWEKVSKVIHCDRTLPEKTISKYIKEHN